MLFRATRLWITYLYFLCSYAGLTQLPAGFVDMVKKFNPNITELELSRYGYNMHLLPLLGQYCWQSYAMHAACVLTPVCARSTMQ